MYAASSSSEFYHLLTKSDSSDLTLCGLRVSPIVIDRPAETSSLHLVSQILGSRSLCEDCAKIELGRILE